MAMSDPNSHEFHKFKTELSKLKLKASVLIIGINTVDPELKASFERIRDAIIHAEEDIHAKEK